MSSSPVEPFLAVASDMDGTLLDPHHQVNAFTHNALAALESRCIPFIFATGRHHADVLETKRKLGVHGYTLTSNGARVHDEANVLILERNLSPDTAKKLALVAVTDPDVTTSIYQGDHWYMNRVSKDLTEFYQDNKDKFYYELFNPESHPSYDNVYKVYYTSDNVPKLDALQKQLQHTWGDTISASFSLPNALEIMAPGVNKGSSLALLMKKIFPNMPGTGEELLKQCLAFGDGLNDYEMLMMAGKGCVVSNAQTRLRERLSRDDPHLLFIGSNAENAVASTVVKLFGLNVPEA